MEEWTSMASEKVIEHKLGDIADPWPVPTTGLQGTFVQNSGVWESAVQRWYLAFCSVEPIQVAAEGGIP